MKSSRLNLISAKWFGEGGQLVQHAYLLKDTDKTKTCLYNLCILPLSSVSNLTPSYIMCLVMKSLEKQDAL